MRFKIVLTYVAVTDATISKHIVSVGSARNETNIVLMHAKLFRSLVPGIKLIIVFMFTQVAVNDAIISNCNHDVSVGGE